MRERHSKHERGSETGCVSDVTLSRPPSHNVSQRPPLFAQKCGSVRRDVSKAPLVASIRVATYAGVLDASQRPKVHRHKHT